MGGFLCFGHRGAGGHEPENTLLSVERALSLGADWVEVDVYLVDGELVVFHDRRLERTTNGRGYLKDHTLAHLRSLDAGKGQRIPLLREVLDLVDGRAGVNIELKGADTAGAAVDLVREYAARPTWDLDRFLLSSFHHRELRSARNLHAEVPIGLLLRSVSPRYARLARDLAASSVHLDQDRTTRRFVDGAHRRGLRVFVFTVNSPEDVARVEALGVDGVFTDFPELVTGRPRTS
jgi:glycerophosphoryl diester phosphodiesterase